MIFHRQKNLAAVTCHFNWCNFYTPVRNLHRFIRQMEIQGIPLYGIELSLNDQFETTNFKNWKQIKVNKENVCFQKEACINIVVRDLPLTIENVAWIDHDFFFCNTNWYGDAISALCAYKVVQLFSDYVYTDIFGRCSNPVTSIIKCSLTDNKKVGARGCAWAARREMWDHGGLYPLSFLGGGDSLFIYSIIDPLNKDVLMASGVGSKTPFRPYLEWKNKILEYVDPMDISYVDGKIIHEWHGNLMDRKYDTRYDLSIELDLTETLSLDETGLIKISNVSDKFYDNIMIYFRNRNEDGLTFDKTDSTIE